MFKSEILVKVQLCRDMARSQQNTMTEPVFYKFDATSKWHYLVIGTDTMQDGATES